METPELKPRSVADLSKSVIWVTSPMLQLSNARSESERGFGNSDRKGDRTSSYYISFKEAKRNVNERSKRNFAKILKRGSLCIVFRARRALSNTVPIMWGFSSAGRAPALQAGGQRFDPANLHSHGSLAQSVRAPA